MGSLVVRDKHLAFISELLANLREAQKRPGLSAEERGRYQRWLEHAASLAESLQLPKPEGDTGGGDGDLPPALLKELRRRKPDQRERQLLAVLAGCGGSADLDGILVGLYRGFGVIEKRRVLQNKLWRLVRKGRISKAKNTRNVFCLDVPASRGRRGKRKR
jgi:hypothetical protein